jgi:hypothetical protein
MITVESSWGMITLNDKGEVVDNEDLLKVDNEGTVCYLLEAVKFDLEEYDKFYEDRFKTPSDKPDHFDVLALGFWKKDGSYEEADHEWRDDIYYTKEEFDKH